MARWGASWFQGGGPQRKVQAPLWRVGKLEGLVLDPNLNTSATIDNKTDEEPNNSDNVAARGPLEAEVIRDTLDKIGAGVCFTVAGKKAGIPFSVVVKSEKRGRSRWFVKVQGNNSSLGLLMLPPIENDRFRIDTITLNNGESVMGALSEVPDSPKSATSPTNSITTTPTELKNSEESYEVLEEAHRDKIGREELHSEDFWLRRGISPTLPGSDAGEWMESLRNSVERRETEISKFVQRGLARGRGRRIEEALEQFYIDHQTSNNPRSSCEFTSLQRRHGPPHTENMSRMEAGNERGRNRFEGMPPLASFNRNARADGNSYPVRARSSDSGGIGNLLDNSGKGRRRTATKGGGCTVKRGAQGGCNEGEVCSREDGKSSSVHHLVMPAIPGSTGVRFEPSGGSESHGVDVSEDNRTNVMWGPEESGSPSRAEIDASGGASVLGEHRNLGHGSLGIFTPQVHRDTPPVSQLRLGIWGGVGTWATSKRVSAIPGTGLRYVRRRVPKYFKKDFLDAPSWESIQDAFPLAVEIQRKKYPLNSSKISN